MKLKMYSICDKATNWIFPFPAYSDQAAIRNFGTEINESPMAKANPGDFELFCVGEFDCESGNIEAYVPNISVCSGLNVVERSGSNGKRKSK